MSNWLSNWPGTGDDPWGLLLPLFALVCLLYVLGEEKGESTSMKGKMEK